jgi:TonB family protein
LLGGGVRARSAFGRARRSIFPMVTRKLAFATLALALVGVATALLRTASAVPAGGVHMVYVRGPADPDCADERERARVRGDAAQLFFTELQCRVHTGWKCPGLCKGDELLVSHVAVKVQKDGKPGDGQVVRNSESREYDEMTVKAVKAGAPFPAPPPSLLDASGAVQLKIEFACDCFERPKK